MFWNLMIAAALVFAAHPAFAAAKKAAGTAPAPAATGPTARQDRPIPMGVSISNTPSLPFIYAGTAGLLVRSFVNPSQKFILSNNHVLGAKGPSLCPNTAVSSSTWTLQPGTLDIGTDPGNNPFYAAGLVAGFLPLQSGLNLADAALSFTTPALAKTEILGIGEPNAALGIATPGMAVKKSGRTTGVTSGTVDSVNATIVVNYGSGCPQFLFIGQTMITPGAFSGGGDSGSAILSSSDNTPVGLLFAGSDQFTAANQLFWVYVLLGVFPDTPPGVGPSGVADLTRVQAALEGRMDPRIAALRQIQSRNQERILAIPGIHAIGIGLDGNELVFKVYGTALSAQIQSALPARIEGVRVVFRQSGSEFTAR